MCSCLHDYQNGPLVSVHFQMNYMYRYLLFHLQNQRQYQYWQSPNRSRHYSKLTLLFTLLLMCCSAFENSWGLHFSVFTSILSLSIDRVMPCLNNDHLNTLTLGKEFYQYSKCFCKRLGDLVTVTNAAPSPENSVPAHENLFTYILFRLQMSTRSFNFNCLNLFF